MSPLYSRAQVAEFNRQGGWPGHLIAKSVAVVEKESGRNSDAVNADPRVASAPPVGLFQVRAYPGRPSVQALKNPVTNAREAYKIYLDAGQKWGPNPWAVCSDRGCTNLDALTAEVARELGTTTGGGLLTGGSLSEAVSGALSPSEIGEQFGDTAAMGGDALAALPGLIAALGNIGDAVTTFIAKLTNVDTLRRVLAGAGAGLLVLVALVVLGRGLVSDAAGAALQAVAGKGVAGAVKAVS